MATNQPDVYLRFKVQLIIEKAGESVLRFILKYGTDPSTPPLPLDEYHENLPADSTAHGKKKKVFNKDELQKIRTDHTWDTFDVTLLFKAIQNVCEKIEAPDNKAWHESDTLEGLIKKIKQERNRFAHEKPQLTEIEFQKKVQDLQETFMKALEEAQKRYSIPDPKISQEKCRLDTEIKKILGRFTLQDFLDLDTSKQLPMFKDMLVTRLGELYDKTQFFDPLSFLSGSPKRHVCVQDVFTKIIITRQPQNLEIDHSDILVFAQSLGQPRHPSQTTQPPQPSHTIQPTQFTHSVHPQLLLIKGDAGSGKTTLLTFMLSEWLKEESENSMKRLHQYDLVIHVLCRDSDCKTLEDLLEEVLPGAREFGPNTITLFNKCKVLFLIDGLDERNPSSRQLVEDILCRRKLVPESTILCTSRPESVVDFLQSVPNEYGKSEGMIQGISLPARTKFVLKYFDCLSSGDGSPNRDKLRQVMESVGWRDHFGLPLNLLFLATLSHKDPDSIRADITQTRLYISMNKWSQEKLQHRLAKHKETKDLDRMTREDGIRNVSDVMCEIALEGLLENRIYLSDHEIRRVREYCKAEKLPCEEVMGAFFSLRQKVTDHPHRSVHQTYHAPHKGLQEFLGAKHITRRLCQKPCNTVDRLQAPASKSIRELLQNPSEEQLAGLKNLLLHVAGLLCQPDVKYPPRHAKEVVDLLAKAGMNSCNDWLSLLEDTVVNGTVLDCVVGLIKSDGDETINISDSNIASAKALLPLIPCKKVEIKLHMEESQLQKLVHPHHVYLKVYLWHSFRQPHQATVPDSLVNALPRKNLGTLMGHLSGDAVKRMREFSDLKYLQLAVLDDQDAQVVLPAIAEACSALPGLQNLMVHVAVSAVTPNALHVKLPDIIDADHFPGVTLVLSGVNEALLERSWRIADSLHPISKGYRHIIFPDSNIEAHMWRRCHVELCNAGVRVCGRIGAQYPSKDAPGDWSDLLNFGST